MSGSHSYLSTGPLGPTEDHIFIENNEHFALIFAAFSVGLLLLIFALRSQRKRIYQENLFKQRCLLSQIFDIYMLRTVTMRIRKKQLDAHRYVLQNGKVIE